MSKNTFFTGQPIFTQLLKFIPIAEVGRLAAELNTDHYYKKFKTYDHLVTMLYTCFHGCKSLREVTTGMQVSFSKLNHLGMRYIPKRSTLSDANRARPEEFFGRLYQGLYKHFYGGLPDSRRNKKMEERLFIIDSTTINLFSDVMKGMGMKPMNGKCKGGAKAHVLMNAYEDVPQFIDLTHGTKNDKVILEDINPKPGWIIVFDRAYNNYKVLGQWTKNDVTWVTRSRVNTSYTLQGSNPVSSSQREKGVLADENIIMGRPSNKTTVKLLARKITYYHKPSKREFEFITNNMKMSPSMIARIYKKRWQIETFFKRIKHSYPLRYFLGDNENAIKIQIWSVFITDLLIKIVKDKIKRKRWSYANIASMIRLHLMSYVNLFKFLNNPEKALINYDRNNEQQLSLYT